MTGRVRMKNGRLAKKSVIDKRKKAILAMALAKERKRNMRKQLELAYEGNRVVNLKTLKEQMQCQTCHAVLDFGNIEEETRQGLFSQWKILCTNCQILNIVNSGDKILSDNKNYSGINLTAVLGKYFCLQMFNNKIYCFMNQALLFLFYRSY